MEYAVIESGGKQYFASIGEVITVDKIDKAVGDKINLEKFMQSINRCFDTSSWLGVEIEKNPLDLMTLQEIIFEKRPDTIIECGTFRGGSALYMASLMDLMNIDGKIFTIDRDMYPRPVHPKIGYIHSDCLTAKLPKVKGQTMLILDCDHHGGHVYAELTSFDPSL